MKACPRINYIIVVWNFYPILGMYDLWRVEISKGKNFSLMTRLKGCIICERCVNPKTSQFPAKTSSNRLQNDEKQEKIPKRIP